MHLSLNAFPALNDGDFDAGMSIGSPVFALRSLRALRCVSLKVPKPSMEIRFPAATSFIFRKTTIVEKMSISVVK